MKEELLKGLTEEQIAKVKSCKSQKELLSIAAAEGIELSEEQLAAVNGGCSSDPIKCPNCGSREYEPVLVKKTYFNEPGQKYRCKKCHTSWVEG